MRKAINPWSFALVVAGLWAISHSASAACLEKPRTSKDGKIAAAIFMIAPESEVAVYGALGFDRVSCPKDLSVVRAYVDKLCAGTGQGKYGPLDTDAVIGRSRTLACTSARAGLVEAGG